MKGIPPETLWSRRMFTKNIMLLIIQVANSFNFSIINTYLIFSRNSDCGNFGNFYIKSRGQNAKLHLMLSNMLQYTYLFSFLYNPSYTIYWKFKIKSKELDMLKSLRYKFVLSADNHAALLQLSDTIPWQFSDQLSDPVSYYS